jgi:hypothetical protein
MKLHPLFLIAVVLFRPILNSRIFKIGTRG